MFPGLDLHYTDPAQHLITAVYDIDDLLDCGLSVPWIVYHSLANRIESVEFLDALERGVPAAPSLRCS